MRFLLAFLALAVPVLAATRLLVTVIEPKTGAFVSGLKASDFSATEDKAERKIESVEAGSTGPLDIMLLLDTGLAGAAVQPVAASLIEGLKDKDQMAVVGYHSSADLIQNFTSSQDLLRRAVTQVKYGNTPRALDALSAVIRDGFEDAVYRRVVILLTTGYDGGSRESERDVVKLARRGGVSIYPVYVTGVERGLFETLARQTGGATFNLNNLRKQGVQRPGVRILDTVRNNYMLTVAGDIATPEKLRIEVRSPGKTFASALVIE